MLFFTHLNLLIRKDKPHQGRSFDTSTGSWQCCLGRKKIQRSHRLASGSLSLWKTVSRGNTDKFLLQVKTNVSFLFRKFSLWFIQTWIHSVSLCSRVLWNNLGAHVCVCVPVPCHCWHTSSCPAAAVPADRGRHRCPTCPSEFLLWRQHLGRKRTCTRQDRSVKKS